jgi:hypothetical protein
MSLSETHCDHHEVDGLYDLGMNIAKEGNTCQHSHNGPWGSNGSLTTPSQSTLDSPLLDLDSSALNFNQLDLVFFLILFLSSSSESDNKMSLIV